MKLTKKIQLAFLTLTLVFFTILSCQKKNNDTAKSLDGKWEITKITKGSGEVDENSMPQSVTLMSCKVRKSNCDGKWVSNNGDEETFFWTITDKGNFFTIFKDDSQSSNQANADLAQYKGVYDILELTDTYLAISKDNIKMEFKK
jgi:hypothetical protein